MHKKIADLYLHVPVRQKELLPNYTQVDFSQPLDFLLAESTRTVEVAAFGRVDLSGGHENGPSLVGLNVIIPEDAGAPYIAQLIRYGADAPAGVVSDGYSFAYPLVARAGNGQVTYVPISNRYGGQNWVEVVNTKDQAVEVRVTFYDQDGEVVGNENLLLEPYAQRHLNASALLGKEGFGYASLSPSRANAIVSQSMFYFRDSATGQMLAMYGLQAREALSSSLHGSYNRFLNMESPWMIHNTSEETTSVAVVVHGQGESRVQTVYELVPRGTLELALENGEVFGTEANTYGVVATQTTETGLVFSEILRVRRTAENLVDFTAPTLLH